MNQLDLDRRSLLAMAAAAPAVLGTGAAVAQASGVATTFVPKPLPFDPKSVPGLSEKLLTSHHDNNYVGAVKRLAAIEGQLASIDPSTAPVFLMNGLKREELIAWNSMIIHELYFSGFGAPNAPSEKLAHGLEESFGSQARWAAEFASMGKALGGGSGWVLLTWSPRDRRLVNTWAADHTMTLAGGAPLLALDMYEHAYAIDYGAKAAAYVDTFMKIIDWRHASATFATIS
ncbi:MAG TPA: Fe-Mn family superoxide dismutase [Caulobacteraceae bacterium]|jgi:Fe-Mn family superoxide dismutase